MDHGKCIWYFPDGEAPQPDSGKLKAHESVILLNPNQSPAHVRMTLYFADADPVENIVITVAPKRVKCIRMDDPAQLNGERLHIGRQYAIGLASDVPIIAQYGRLDTTQPNMAFYTTPGYSQ